MWPMGLEWKVDVVEKQGHLESPYVCPISIHYNLFWKKF